MEILEGYAFHIEFEDGSNPYYHFPCLKEEHEKALRKWRKNYELKLIKRIGTMEFYKAKEKKQ